MTVVERMVALEEAIAKAVALLQETPQCPGVEDLEDIDETIDEVLEVLQAVQK
ncbi:hypothetical protein [Bacillus sp. OTU530]|uniref:hypothetical protein n=1 Tax=Bacillus sp. OTU530 TaxID=3043862 RepID=UPI00313AC7F0